MLVLFYFSLFLLRVPGLYLSLSLPVSLSLFLVNKVLYFRESDGDLKVECALGDIQSLSPPLCV